MWVHGAQKIIVIDAKGPPFDCHHPCEGRAPGSGSPFRWTRKASRRSIPLCGGRGRPSEIMCSRSAFPEVGDLGVDPKLTEGSISGGAWARTRLPSPDVCAGAARQLRRAVGQRNGTSRRDRGVAPELLFGRLQRESNTGLRGQGVERPEGLPLALDRRGQAATRAQGSDCSGRANAACLVIAGDPVLLSPVGTRLPGRHRRAVLK